MAVTKPTHKYFSLLVPRLHCRHHCVFPTLLTLSFKTKVGKGEYLRCRLHLLRCACNYYTISCQWQQQTIILGSHAYTHIPMHCSFRSLHPGTSCAVFVSTFVIVAAAFVCWVLCELFCFKACQMQCDAMITTTIIINAVAATAITTTY